MITYIAETIWHFKCGACQLWWDIPGHFISSVRTHDETLTCPHCGNKDRLEPLNHDTQARSN